MISTWVSLNHGAYLICRLPAAVRLFGATIDLVMRSTSAQNTVSIVGTAAVIASEFSRDTDSIYNDTDPTLTLNSVAVGFEL